jgi:HAD superfamily hydrolase (TIGR01509 family)
MIRGIFFDAGNTLVLFDCEYLAEVIREVHEPVSGSSIREAEYKARFAIDVGLLSRMERNEEIQSGAASMHSADLWLLYFSTLLRLIGIAKDKHSEVIQRLIQKEKATAKGLWHRLEPELCPVLSQLRRAGYFLGVISNSDGRLTDKFADLQLTQYFDLILDSEDVGVEKPDPRLFHIGLRQSGLAASDALYIGDLYTVDVLAARRAGMQARLYDPAGLYHQYEPLGIRRWGDLMDVLHHEADDRRTLESGVTHSVPNWRTKAGTRFTESH